MAECPGRRTFWAEALGPCAPEGKYPNEVGVQIIDSISQQINQYCSPNCLPPANLRFESYSIVPQGEGGVCSYLFYFSAECTNPPIRRKWWGIPPLEFLKILALSALKGIGISVGVAVLVYGGAGLILAIAPKVAQEFISDPEFRDNIIKLGEGIQERLKAA